MLIKQATAIAAVMISSTLAAATDYYASPGGSGDGRSPSRPLQIAAFWPIAKPGDTLLLLDGKYTGGDSMITPPRGLKGTRDAPITVKALNDGEVEIDGEGKRPTVKLYYNDYFVLEGFNAHSAYGGKAAATTISLMRSNHNIVRRVCAWDSQDANTSVFGVHHGRHNLIEDCAGFGVARKIFTNSQHGDYTIFRRCWARWEGCHMIGPKMSFSLYYNSYHNLMENCIGTWNALRMRESHEAHHPPTGKTCSYANYQVDQPYGILRADRLDGAKEAHCRMLGCIAYATKDQRFDQAHAGLRFGGVNELEVKDCVVYLEQENIHPCHLTVTTRKAAGTGLSACNLTLIGPKPSEIHPRWKTGSIYSATDARSLVKNGGNILQPGSNGIMTGATIMKCYENGVLTDENLWPWPMNQRIAEATALAGYEPIDVTKTVLELGGGTMPDLVK